MAKLTKPKPDDVDTATAKSESKKEIELKEDQESKLSPILTLLRLVLINTLRVVGDINPTWVDAILLLNYLTSKAPIASLTGNKEYAVIDDDAFKDAVHQSNGHAEVISMYKHPTFPDGDGNTYMDLGKRVGMKEILELASMVMRRFLGQRGVFFDEIIVYPKVAFVFAVYELVDGQSQHRNIEYRHDPNSKLTPAQQDDARKKRRSEWKPPTVWVEGKHSLCEHIIDGKRCNQKHLRIHCLRFNRLCENTAAIVSTLEEETVGLVFEYDSRVDGPGEFQDGTPAWEFNTDDAVTAATPPRPLLMPAVADYGSNAQVEVPTPVFEPMVDPPPAMTAAPQPAATWSVDTVVNLLALLMVLSLGCSMFVPANEQGAEDDNVFYVSAPAGESAPGRLRTMALMCLLSCTSAVQSVVTGVALTEAYAAAAMIATSAMVAAAVAVAMSANAVAAAEQQQVEDVLEARRLRGAGRAAGEFRRRVNRLPFGATVLLVLVTCASPVRASPPLSAAWREWLRLFEIDMAPAASDLAATLGGYDGMAAIMQLVIMAVVMPVVWQVVAAVAPESTPTSDASVQTSESTAEWMHDNGAGNQPTMSMHELQLGLMDEIARLRSISEQAPAATADVAVQTDGTAMPTAEVATDAEVRDSSWQLVRDQEALVASPLPTRMGFIWIVFAYSKAGVQFLKARGARWCSVRGSWYMHLTSQHPHRHRRRVAALQLDDYAPAW
jgi:hypothetical protein